MKTIHIKVFNAGDIIRSSDGQVGVIILTDSLAFGSSKTTVLDVDYSPMSRVKFFNGKTLYINNHQLELIKEVSNEQV